MELEQYLTEFGGSTDSISEMIGFFNYRSTSEMIDKPHSPGGFIVNDPTFFSGCFA